MTMKAGRDVWWHDIVERQSEVCPPVAVDSEHMLYLLYTCGTTAKPKGIMHTSAGYLLGTSFTHWVVFDVKPDDVYWCAADIGWVTGHSYIVYGPLANATTSVMYEGAPDTPGLGSLVADRRGLQGHHALLRADGDPRLHEAGRRVPAQARPFVAAPAGQRRRADQPRSVAVVPAQHRRRQRADRRHLVADRDGHDPDHAAARRDDDQARLGDLPVPRRRRRRRRLERRFGALGRRRLPGPDAAVAVDAARHLRRSRSATRRPTGAASRASTSPATAPSATRTAISGCSAGSTT